MLPEIDNKNETKKQNTWKHVIFIKKKKIKTKRECRGIVKYLTVWANLVADKTHNCKTYHKSADQSVI